MLNRIVLIGRLTRDPELRYTPASGVAVATFTLAVNRIYSKQKEADFIPIVVWRNQAKLCKVSWQRQPGGSGRTVADSFL